MLINPRFNKLFNKQIVIYQNNQKRLGNRKEQSTDAGSNVAEPEKHQGK